MGDKPDYQQEKSSRDCDFVYELKDNAQDVLLTESLYKDAQLICPGDSKRVSDGMVNAGHLPALELGQNMEPETVLLARMALRGDRSDEDSLSPGQKEALFGLEEAIVRGDSAAVTARLMAFEHDPKQAEKLMAVLVQDLEKVGYHAQWTYSTDESRPGYGQEYDRGPAFGGGYYQSGREDVGHLTITSDAGHDTYNSVSFSTRGESAAINTPKPSIDGSASSSVPSPMKPDDALKEAAEHAAHTA